MIYGIGIDPGSRGAVALVEWPGRGHLPRAVGAWSVYGRWPDLWYDRAVKACRSAWSAAGDIVEHPPAGLLNVRVWQETFPAKSRGGKISPTAWIGLGRRCGALLCAFHRASGWVWPEEVENTAWRQAWDLGPKRGDGTHRLQECRLYIQGSGPVLDKVRPSCLIDSAEALLIAGAAAMSGGTT